MNYFFLRKLVFLGTLLIVVSIFPAAVSNSSTLIVATVLSSDQPRYRNAHKAFVRAMAAKGYDQTAIELVTQIPNPDPISWSNAIRKFNAIGANIIVTFGAPASLAALQESHDIPIVFVDVYAPLETGIAKSLAAPGNNATGVSSKVPLSTLIRTTLEFKQFKQIGVLYTSREIGSVVQLKEIKRLAVQHRFSVVESNVESPATLDLALSSLLSQIDCLYVTESSVVGRQLDKVIRRAMDQRIPVITQVPDGGEKGALLSLEAHPGEMGHQAADLAAKVIAGRKPAIIPIVAPKKVDMIVNMKTARVLDLHVPIQVLNVATRIIK
ncbi:ABC transporter substrate binding protein [Geobacter sp. OR-1]|uniref:ABC transporter substrate-binding protein n=1 Tax=Geobacter sp. OR-1 TaxID=1266765 RepID=UPI00054320D6|nr:ABC transporter substrate-binding protein [Geobacter sp. OR-1]GAM11060.1 ABC transporter substrate binding protein [Geobacter sp. OR-1]